jgi:DNA-directed RNA polymerase specialized sigma24 family protein
LDEADSEAFDRFVREVEPRLRRALVATYGQDRGREAAAEALAWAFEHRAELERLDHPAAYLYKVGQSRTRERRQRRVFETPVFEEPWVEPGLAAALAALPARQRSAVVLVYGAGLTMAEAAEVLGASTGATKKRASRGMTALKRQIKGVET